MKSYKLDIRDDKVASLIELLRDLPYVKVTEFQEPSVPRVYPNSNMELGRKYTGHSTENSKVGGVSTLNEESLLEIRKAFKLIEEQRNKNSK